MGTKQPEALRLAEMLEQEARLLLKPGSAAAAAELRRLQAENETMRAGYDAARLEIASLHAQAQPVAYGQPDDPDSTTAFSWPGTARHPHHNTPLYTAPQPAAKALDAQNEVGALLRKYRSLCVKIGRGDSHHLARIDAAIAAQQGGMA